MLNNESDVSEAVLRDDWMMGILRAARSLGLPDWWVCAGFIRSKIWDVQHGYAQRTPLADIDVVYFDAEDTREAVEKHYERRLRELMPEIPWSVKNQARMHVINGSPPYTSAVDGIAKFSETATALGAKLTSEEQLLLTAPCGYDDVLQLRVRPCDYFKERQELWSVYERRVRTKQWEKRWPRLTFEYLNEPDMQQPSDG